MFNFPIHMNSVLDADLTPSSKMMKTAANYASPDSHLKVYLKPGEFCLAEKPTEVWTILGSCLAIIFYNPRLQLGAIAHAQLAEKCLYEGNCTQKCSDYCPGPCYHQTLNSNPYKYVSCSIRSMLELFTQYGVLTHEINVQLFGGASILPLAHPVKSVGHQNIEVALKVLEQCHLRVTNKDVGGISGRTLYFYSDTGKVFLKPHRRLALTPRTSDLIASSMVNV